MHRTAVQWLVAISLGLASSSAVLAQSSLASLTHVDHGSTRLHDGVPAAATIGAALNDGDQIHTTAGRAEITYFDGTVVSLDRHTRAMVHAGDRIHVLQGRISLRTGGLKPYVAETAAAKLRVQAGGVVEMTIGPALQDTLARVISGVAHLEGAWGARQVPDYHTAYVAGPGAAPQVSKAPVTNADDFERWALARTVLATSIVLKGTEGGGGVAYAPSYYSWQYAAPVYSYEVTPYVSPHAVAPYYNASYYTPYYYGSYSYYGTPYPYASPYVRSYYYSPYSYYNYSRPHYPYSSYGDRSYSWRRPEQHRAPVEMRMPQTRSVPGTSRGAVVPRP